MAVDAGEVGIAGALEADPDQVQMASLLECLFLSLYLVGTC